MQFRPLVLLSLFAFMGVTASTPRADDVPGSPPSVVDVNAPLNPSLERLVEMVERRRQEQGVPGVALVLVKDDKVILNRGFGVRDVAQSLPVTPKTLFRIGSATKAFTAALAEMSVDEGKLALDASPKRYLSYFKLRDATADKEATLRDFLSHRSGLKRTDLAWSTGALSRQEVIRAIGDAKPTAPLRSLFQYNNVGYSIVGEAVAEAQGKSWEELVSQRIFTPLGMASSHTSAKTLATASDYATAYRVGRGRVVTSVPSVDTSNIAAATALVSNTTDMAQWLRLMLNEGVYEGRSLLSRRGYREMLTPQTRIDLNTQYGLGWYLEEWRGHRVVRHGGTLGSFRTEMALMPDQHLGFVLLANASSEPLQSSIDNLVWGNLVASPDGRFEEDRGPGWRDRSREQFPPTGREGLPDESAPNPNGRGAESRAPLEGDDAPPRQREGNFAPRDRAFANEPFGPWRELVASYRSTSGSVVEIAWRNGRALFVVPAGNAYGLLPRGEDFFALGGLSNGFALRVLRDEQGQVSSVALKQPVGDMTYERMPDFVPPLSADELMARVIKAAGGEENLRRHTTWVTTFEANFENEGVTAQGTFKTRLPNSRATDLVLLALNKPIGTVHEYFQGETAGVETDWNGQPFTSNPTPFINWTVDYQNALDVAQLLDWQTMFKSIVIKRVGRVGSETAYVVEKTPVRGNPITDYISTNSFRLLKRESPLSGWVRGAEVYEDYRMVDGVAVPYRIEVESPRLGTISIRVQDADFEKQVSDADFGPKKP